MTTRVISIVVAIIACAIGRGSTSAQESPMTQEPSPSSRSVSPDKQWEYKCDEYGVGQCAPEILKAGTTEVVLDLDDDVNGPDAKDATVIWAPDSKRFAFNYSPPHAHHTRYVTVAFYQLVKDKWEQLPSLLQATEQSQLVELAKKHLLKSINPHKCTPNWDVLKVRSWADDNTAILYAPCRARGSGAIENAFLFTVRFDADGNSKIIKTKRLSGKEADEE